MKIKDLTGFNTKELVEGRHGSFTNYYDSDGNDLRGGNDEANLWYRYDPHEGRLKQNMIAGHQEREARNLGYRDGIEAALRVHNIIKSKYHQGKWIQNQGGKWVEVHPFGKPQGVAEAANAAQQAAIAIAKKKAVDETAAWQKKSGKNKNGGLNKKGVDSYRREHPGSKLQTAVTKKPSKIKKGSKDDKRRKSFCARMSGMKGPMKKPNGEPTRKALSLRKWHCESIENLDVMLAEAISEAKNLGNRVKIVKGPEAGQTGTIGEIRPGAFKGAPGYYTVDLDNGGHIQVRKEMLRLIKDEVNESLRPGEYYVWTVYFDDGTSKRIKVTSDEFDPYAYYAKQNKVVVNVDYDWSIQGQ